MVGRKVEFVINKNELNLGNNILEVKNLIVFSEHKNKVNDVSFVIKKGEIVCIAGIEGNGQSEVAHAITGLNKIKSGTILLNGIDITHKCIDKRNKLGLAHIPEDRHKHGLILDFSLENNMILKKINECQFQRFGFIKINEIRKYSNDLINKFDIRSSLGTLTITRSMSGGNQQKTIIARELDLNPDLLIAVQPTRGLDIGAIEYIHKRLLEQRDLGKGILLISLELEEVMNISDRILVMYEGQIVGELDPKKTSFNELGLYMSGSKRDIKGDL
jgi:simple sugar transport system ATP-binding protein